MMYVGSRHDEIAAMLSPGEEPQPQRLLPGLSVRGSTQGRGEANSGGSSLSRRAIQSPEQRLPRPRPDLSDAI